MTHEEYDYGDEPCPSTSVEVICYKCGRNLYRAMDVGKKYHELCRQCKALEKFPIPGEVK